MEKEPLTVIIYGDSNTWGYDADSPSRFPHRKRWVNILRTLLNSEQQLADRSFEVISEGLNGRTTIYSRELAPGEYDRNGRATFLQILNTHKPLSLIVIALGTNDLNEKYAVGVAGALNGIRMLVEDVRNYAYDLGNASEPPKILVLGIPALYATELSLSWLFPSNLEELAKDVQQKLPNLCEELAVEYLDITQVTTVSPTDGIHLTLEVQDTLAAAVSHKIQSILSVR